MLKFRTGIIIIASTITLSLIWIVFFTGGTTPSTPELPQASAPGSPHLAIFRELCKKVTDNASNWQLNRPSCDCDNTSDTAEKCRANVTDIAEQSHRNVNVHSVVNTPPTANEVVDLVDDAYVIEQVIDQGESVVGGEDVVTQDVMPDRGWIFSYLLDVERERQRGWMAHRIDCYFDARRSPMKGLGRYIVLSAERYGHDPRLCAAIAEAESTCGKRCYNNPPGGCSYNAWGMLAYRSGFASWEQGVDAMFDWLFKYNGVCTSAPLNWCEPPDPWRSNVNKVMNSI